MYGRQSLKQHFLQGLFRFQLKAMLPGFKGVWQHDLDDSEVKGPQLRTVMKRSINDQRQPFACKEACAKAELMSEATQEAVIWHVKKCRNVRCCAICNYLKGAKTWSETASVKLNGACVGSWLLVDSDSDKQEVGLSCP